MKVSELLEKVPQNTKERVTRTLRARNQQFRNELRVKTALSLQGRGGERQVSILVDEVGAPDQLKSLEIPPGRELAAILSLWATSIHSVIEGTGQLSEVLRPLDPQFRDELDVDRLVHFFDEAQQGARLLREVIGDFRLGQWLMEQVNEDIAGSYRASAPSERGGTSTIRLYWGVIGLFAMTCNVSVEAMTCVVLAHELAHAYTHLGFDLDQRTWPEDAFWKSDIHVVEGLAQYYTLLLMEKEDERLPGHVEAFQKLLRDQPRPYHAHQYWVEKATPEAIRAALVICRPKGPALYESFSEEIIGHVTRTRVPATKPP